MRVLVTDGDTRAALAITRALGRRGHTVLVGEKRDKALAHASRYCCRKIVYPDPVCRDAEFVQEIARLVVSERADVLIPVADIATLLVTSNRSLFEPGCSVPFADAAAVERAADKVAAMRTAERLGVAIPRTWHLPAPACPAPCDLPFPVVIKPHRSRVRTKSSWESCRVRYAWNAEELRATLERMPAHEFPLMLQERIEGPGIGVFVCYDRGRLIALFGHRRLREKPPWGGVSVLCESVEVCPLAREYTERLMRDLDWHGVAMVEFKHDFRDGVPKLMEINGRFWGSLQLAVDAGVDFPNILLDTCRGSVPEGSLPAYRPGIKSRWLWGDFDSLLTRLTAGRNAGPASDHRGRVGAVLQFLRLVSPGLRYDNPKADDIRPWLRETGERLWRH